MTVRPLDLLDLPFLYRHRNSVLALDTGRMLTRGNPIGARAMLSYLNPNRQLYTAVTSENGSILMGQVILRADETSARLTFLAPAGEINGVALSLLENLVKQAGDWGALHVLAEVDDESTAFKTLRQAGFAMHAWQRVWKLPRDLTRMETNPWREAEDIDWHAVQMLHGQIVPALLHPVESLPKETCGWVCRLEDILQAYAAVDIGTQGIWLRPLVPPDSASNPGLLLGLVKAVRGRSMFPTYVCVRSYQAWLESTLVELGAEAGPRQAVMVKRLAATVKDQQTHQVLEKAMAKIKPATPVARIHKAPGSDANHDG